MRKTIPISALYLICDTCHNEMNLDEMELQDIDGSYIDLICLCGETHLRISMKEDFYKKMNQK